MGLISAELFEDRVYITVTATGNPLLLAAPTCFQTDELGNRAALNVAEIGNGLYRTTNFTPDAAGTWFTEWAVAGANTIHYPYKIFKVDGGQEGAIITAIGIIDAFHDVPAQDAVANAQMRDVIGNKTDTVAGTSIVSYIQIADANIDTILARVTAAVATEAKQDIIDTNVDDIETDTSDMQPRIPRITCFMDFWSDLQEEAQLGAGDEAGVIALPDVVVADLPAGITITRSIAMYLFRALENTNAAANAVDVATGHIEVRDDGPGVWTTAINFPDNSFGVAGETREMGTVVLGDNDVSGEVDGNDTYEFQFDDIGVDVDFLNMNDLQTGLRIYFTV